MDIHPPKWADRFLAWYCNPDLLEEIQGDAHELYYERLKLEGKTSADWEYVFDVLRFCRWSNIKRSANEFRPGYLGILWNLNFKIALRHALRNKLVFSVKMIGLSVCLAFALVVSAFVIHEYTFDQHYPDHERIFRIGTQADVEGVITDYAVSPVALADALAEEIPEVETAAWVMNYGKPAFTVGAELFNNESTLLASSDFLKVLKFEYIYGTDEALDEPNAIVLTETTAKKIFRDADPIDQTINLGWSQLHVAAIVKDIPLNSHLQFNALISWDTYDFNDGWDNVNAYTYIKLKSGAAMKAVEPKIRNVLVEHREDMEDGRDYWMGNAIKIYPIIHKISAIHLSPVLDEDIAVKRTKTHIYILIAVVVLFFITGLINFLNLSLAEFTANLRKLTILQVFGGSTANHNKVIITNTALSIFVVLPLTVLLIHTSLILADHYFSMPIDGSAFVHPAFLSVAGGFLLVFVFSSKINAFVLSRSNDITNALKGKLSPKQSSFRVREFLVSTQLSFSIIMIALIVIIVDQFRFIDTTDKGFEDRNTVVIKMREGDFSRAEAFKESLKKLNGVKEVDANSYYLDNVEVKEFFEVDTDKGPVKMLVAYMNCGYEYFEAMNIPFVKGRNFQRDHNDNKTTYIVNETAAREFGWQDPIGQRISGPLGTDRDEGEVIGVVKDFHFASLHSKIEPLIIFLVNEDWGIRYVYVKLNPVHPKDILSQIENEYRKSYQDLPFDWDFLDVRYANLYKKDYEIGYVFQVGLVISILVSCLGIFSMSALLLMMRAKEMGIRKVVGATQLQLVLLHIRSFIKFIVIAVLIAWPVIFYLSQNWLDNFAYHIDLNMWYFIFPGLITLLIILITSGFHGIKSAHVNPVDILKHE